MKTPRILKIFLMLSLAAIFSAIVYLSFKWCHYNEIFTVNSIYIKGNNITSNDEILQICQDLYNESIFSIDEETVQGKLEKLPYVQAACVSRLFPSSIVVRIYEKKPLSFVKSKKLYVADENFTLLPLPESKKILNLPVINYQLKTTPKLKELEKINDENIINALSMVKVAKYRYADLYKHISEVVINQDGFSIITTDKGVPVYLGKNNLEYKLKILSRFQQAVGNTRVYTQFHYIDLRWKKQIIVGDARKRG